MPRLTTKVPTYRLHKPSGRAIVTLDSRDHYLGEHGSLESFEKYKKLLAEWIAKRDEPPGLLSLDDPVPEDLRLDELLLSYLEFAKGYYVKNGKPTGEFTNMKHAVKPLADLYSGHRVGYQYSAEAGNLIQGPFFARPSTHSLLHILGDSP